MGEMLSIIWNPDVVAIDLGFIAIRWYSLCWALGLLAVYILMHRLFRQQRLSEESVYRRSQQRNRRRRTNSKCEKSRP